jgi:acid phosphatase
MLFSASLLLLAGASVANAAAATSEPPESTVAPSGTQISAAAASATVLSPTSNVKGLAFQKFYQVWLENTDYSASSGDGNQLALAKEGITL